MPRDPFIDFFFGNRNNNDSNNNNNNNNDPFNDPFFRHMNRIMDEFFNGNIEGGINKRGPTIIIDHSQPNQNNSNVNNSFPQQNSSNQRPHLSQINPNIQGSDMNDNNNNNNTNNNTINERNNDNIIIERRERFNNDPINILSEFFDFDPFGRNSSKNDCYSYQEPSLTDINPNLNNKNDNQIINDKNQDSNLVHPHEPPHGFRSPYLPNWNGAEKSMRNLYEIEENPNVHSFFRSKSVIISTTPDGKTTKKTTVRDENGNVQESTETYDNFDNNESNESNMFGIPKNMIDFGFKFPFGQRNNDINDNWNNDNNNNKPSISDDIINNGNNNPWLVTPNDPFGRIRHRVDGWKDRMKNYWFGGWNRNNNENSQTWGFNKNNSNKGQEWFWKYKNNNNNNNERNNNENPTKIEWKDSRHYRRPNENDASKLRSQIIKPQNDKSDE